MTLRWASMSIVIRIRWVLLPLRASFSKVDASYEKFAAICETREICSPALFQWEIFFCHLNPLLHMASRFTFVRLRKLKFFLTRGPIRWSLQTLRVFYYNSLGGSKGTFIWRFPKWMSSCENDAKHWWLFMTISLPNLDERTNSSESRWSAQITAPGVSPKRQLN